MMKKLATAKYMTLLSLARQIIAQKTNTPQDTQDCLVDLSHKDRNF